MSATAAELHASENEALTALFHRTGWEMGWEGGKQVPVARDLPFDEMIAAEDDGEAADTVGEYEIRQRMIGARGFIRFLQAHGPHPTEMLKQLADACRAMHIAPFHMMTMKEQAMFFGQCKAAVSFRGKVLSREIRVSGMRADKLPGQKGKEASESYRAVRHRQQHLKLNGRAKPKARQKSFLRELRVAVRKTGNRPPASLGKALRAGKPDTGRMGPTGRPPATLCVAPAGRNGTNPKKGK